MPHYEFLVQGLTEDAKKELQTASVGEFQDGVYAMTNRKLIGGASIQPFKEGKAVITFGLLPEHNNQDTTKRVLDALIDHYGTFYEYAYKSFITIVNRRSQEEHEKMEKSGWRLDASLSEEWSNELNTNATVYSHNNPHYTAEEDLPKEIHF